MCSRQRIEQQVSLDEFQTLVDQGRELIVTTAPSATWMRQRLPARNTAQLLAPPTPEWGLLEEEDEVRNLDRPETNAEVRLCTPEANAWAIAGVLGIHRNTRAGETHRALYQRTANDHDSFASARRHRTSGAASVGH